MSENAPALPLDPVTTAATSDPRDHVWREGFRLYYDALYQQYRLEALLKRWTKCDTAAGLTVAFTTSSSAIGGWTVWNNPYGKALWMVLVGIGAIVSIAQRYLNTSARLRDIGSCHGRIQEVATEVENVRSQMRMDPNFDINELRGAILRLRSKLHESCLKGTDLLCTDELERAAQARVNRYLRDEIA